MKIRIHGKNLSKKFRFGVLGMTELSLLDLLDNSKVCKNLEVDVHFRHYSDIGEAMVHEDEFRRYPRRFRVIIDPYRLEVDDYDRKRNDEEVVSEMFRVLGHELVHVKQYVVGDLAISKKLDDFNLVFVDEDFAEGQLMNCYNNDNFFFLS